MSRSGYTSSERRGVLAIAIIALLIISFGVGVSLINQNKVEAEVMPDIKEFPELIDSTALRNNQENSLKKPGKNKKSSDKKKKEKKTYRKRSPLDEPV